MAKDVKTLLAILNNSGIQQTNNPLYQTVEGLINAVQSIPIAESQQVTVYNCDTRSAPVSIPLSTAVKGFTIFKDQYGNAATNNITLVGTLEGVTDPVIGSDYGFIKIYASSSGFLEW